MSVNYSLLLDQAILQMGGKPDYGVKASPLNDEPDLWSRPTVELLKPHGSINFLVPVALAIDYHPGSEGQPRNWNVSETITLPNQPSIKARPLITPPNRGGKCTGYEGEGAILKQIRDALQQRLPDVEHCFIIGWSAPRTDEEDIVKLLRDGLKNCQSCSVLNKTSGSDVSDRLLKDRYGEIFKSPIDSFRWDWDGMREPHMIPLWNHFLKL